MKKIPIMFQLFLILFSILVIPTIILTYYTTSKMVKYSQEEIANSAISELEANRDMSENIMYGIVQDVLRMVVTNDFNIVKDIPSFEVMNKNITNIKKARELREQLNSMLYNDGIIHSIYFYLDDSDYVISTDKGITKLSDYESIDWMKEAIKGKASGVGFWCPRELSLSSVNEVESRKNNAISLNVISYVYRLSTLTTSTKGTVVVNVREDGLNEFMDQENDNEASESYLIEKSGRIIGAKEKELFLTDGSSNPIIAYVLKSNSPSGYGYYEDANGKMLYTYVTMDTEGWIYLKMTSLDFLMGKTNQLRMNVIFVTVIIILCGTISTVLLATRISKPMRDLVAR
ncbi:MAG: cache domain-containing protein, partial [Lachnospiraceae bacterium]